MRSSFSATPPGAVYNIIPTAGQHTQLQSDYGAYRLAVGSSKNRKITNSIGANMNALRFQTSFLIPNMCPVSIVNPTGLPVPLSVLDGTTGGFLDESYIPGLGPLVLNLGTIQ
jgi:hypothetical protein